MSVNSLPPFPTPLPTPRRAAPTPPIRGTSLGLPPRGVTVLLGLWVLVAVVVMIYFIHRTIDAIDISQRPTPHPIEVFLLPDASEIERITVMAGLPFEDRAVLAVKAWASPRSTVADCSLVLWMIDPPNIPERSNFLIPASEFSSFLAMFGPAPKNAWLLGYSCSWGYDLEITTNSGEYIKISTFPYPGGSDGIPVVASIRAGKEWASCYVADGDRLNEMIVKAMWARK